MNYLHLNLSYVVLNPLYSEYREGNLTSFEMQYVPTNRQFPIGNHQIFKTRKKIFPWQIICYKQFMATIFLIFTNFQILVNRQIISD